VTASLSPTARRYLAIWLPFLPSDRLRRQERRPPVSSAAPVDAPVVLVEPVKGALRLAAVDRRGLELGLVPGLALADARARLPGLRAVQHDPVADAALIDRMAEDCDRWTPLVALDAPHGLMLDVTACAHLFGGEEGLRRRVLSRFRSGGFEARAAIAGTPEAARACARFSPVEIVPPGGEAQAVGPLPIAALELPEESRLALSRAGLKRIRDLLDQPTQPLAARFGEALPVRLRRVTGREDRRITPLRAPPACLVEQPFPEPIARTEDIERTLHRLLARAALVMEPRGEGGRRFEASFFRTDGAVRRVSVGTGRPTRDPDVLMRLFRERLEALADPLDPGFGFDLVRVAVPVLEPVAVLQSSLEGESREEDDFAALVDRLVARHGLARVLRFATRDTHDPLRQSLLVPADRPLPPATPEPDEDETPRRPLRLFEPPQPVEVLAEVPDGPPVRFRWRRVLHEVARAEGPERIAPEWWRDADVPTRDYYRVEDAQGRRFWLYRAGLYDREPHTPRWYLQGLFA